MKEETTTAMQVKRLVGMLSILVCIGLYIGSITGTNVAWSGDSKYAGLGASRDAKGSGDSPSE